MDLLFGLIQGILGIGWSILSFIFTLIIVIVICAIALFKRRNVALWGIAGLFFPWLILIIPFVPVKRPKLRADLRNHEAFRGKNPMVASIMALAAIVAKTDGAISKEEIGVVKDFISKHFGIVGDQLLSYGDAFNYGKNHPEEYVEFARLVGSYYGTRDVVSAIAYLLVSVAVQDGSISDKEDLKLRQILGEMGFSEYEYRSLKNAFTHEYSSYDYFGGYGNNYGNGSYSQGTQGGAMSQATLIKKYSEVLGVSEDASMSEIKKAYRKLVKEYHPDKLASESMPEDYIEYANKKIIEINEAYEYLKGIKEA